MRQLKNMIFEYLIYAVIFSILVILVCSKKEETPLPSSASTPQIMDSTTVTTTDSINTDGV